MKKLQLLCLLCFGWMALAQESYSLSPESVLTITGTSTVHDWEVNANKVHGSLIAKNNGIQQLTVEVPVMEIKSERGATMDNKMYAALKGEEHPTVLFLLARYDGDTTMKGALTIAGTEVESEIPVKITYDTDSITISGKNTIELKAYGITPPTAMFGQIVVGDTVIVAFDFTFVKA